MNTPLKRGVDSLERAFEMLNAFRDGAASLSLAELAQRTRLHKSTLLRLFVSLERYGYLARLANGRYALGGTLFQLGNLYRDSFRPAEMVRPTLERLSAQMNESASFWILDGEHRVCLCRVESRQSVRDALFREGDRLQLDRGPTSTLLRAFLGAKGRRFEEVRRDATAVSRGLYRPDVAGIACPVFAAGGTIAGAVTLTGPANRFEERLIARMKDAVRDAAGEITRTLGGIAPAGVEHAGSRTKP